jgi:hypothetical protein
MTFLAVGLDGEDALIAAEISATAMAIVGSLRIAKEYAIRVESELNS